MRQNFAFAFVAFMLAGCCSTQGVVSQPSNITLENAMVSVAESFKKFQTAEGDMRLGLLPSEISVTFNISASGQDNQKIVLDLNPTAIVKAGGEVGSTLSATRGNQITIKFQNLFLAPKDTLITMKNPEELQNLFKKLNEAGVVSFAKVK